MKRPVWWVRVYLKYFGAKNPPASVYPDLANAMLEDQREIAYSQFIRAEEKRTGGTFYSFA